MNRKFLRLFALLFAVCMVLTACSGSGTPSSSSAGSAASGGTSSESASATADAPVTAKGEFPIVTEPLTLDIAARVTATVEDIETNYATTWLEEVSGIDMEFTMLPTDEEEAITKINLMMASGEDVDVYTGVNMTTAAVQEYATAGWIVPIDEYIEAYGAGYEELMTDLGDMSDMFLKYVTFADGQRYSLNYVSTVSTNMYYNNCWIYTPWLEQLGFDGPPTTLDEFYEFCLAIKNNDPNGNGQADEIPISGDTTKFNRLLSFIGNAYQNMDFTWWANVTDGKVNFTANNDQYRATLEYLNKLYSDGLIDPNYFTQSASDMKAIFAQEDLRVGVLFTNSPSNYMDTTVEPCLDFRIVEPFSQDGFSSTTCRGMSVYHDWLITSSCENPAAAYRLGDLILSSYGSDVVRYGEEGVDWEYAKEGDVDIVGNPAYMTILNDVWGYTTQNKIWRNNNIPYHIKQTYLERTTDGNDREYENKKYIGTNAYIKYAPEEYIPETMIFASADDEARVAILKNDINTYVEEQSAAFITGTRSFDTWDAYVQEFEMLGLEEYISILQAGYDVLSA